ncbi:MAG: hypothetical protein KJ061_03610 [Vicinamibacteraceae bacterium]|nr:hypothetical protein [Vicinamibacteraceae bacterium]
MRQWVAVVVVVAVAAGAAACGKSESEKRAEAAAKQAEEAAKGLEGMAKGFEAMAKQAEEAAKAMPDGETPQVEPVSFRDLQALFPTVEGWEMAKPSGEKMTSPFAFSKAEVDYQKGESSVSVEITDSGFNQMLFAPFMMFMAQGYEKETSEGYEKSTKVGDYPAWERWSSDTRDGELNVVVGKRFLVRVEGDGIDDMSVLHDVAKRIDMGKLAQLK